MSEGKGTNPTLPILLVDDEESILASYEMALRLEGFDNIRTISDSRTVIGALADHGASLVVLDLTMPHLKGDALLEQISEKFPESPVIMATGNDQLETAVQCMRAGALDFLVKPIGRDRLIASIRQALHTVQLSDENRRLAASFLSNELRNPEIFADFVSNHSATRTIFQYIEAIAPSSQSVLITGETGTGKEIIARTVHRASGRKGKFVAVNVAGLDDTVFSDTLFGHVKGAFTGAETPRGGMIEQAAGGTLFLDEIGDLTPMSQTKLLRLLQEREYQPLGSDFAKHTDARVIFATHKNLEELLAQGHFRRDLYYRLCTHRINIPPLRDRLEDLPLLLDFFLADAANQLGKKAPRPPRELVNLLSTYDFPGNVRELQAMVFDAVSQHTAMMLSMDVFKARLHGSNPSTVPAPVAATDPGSARVAFGKKLPSMNEVKDQLIAEALRRAGGNKTLAASMLGITRQAISKREGKDG